ncbi:hypothetical protein [Embleya sp. NPDC005971]|uniref:hypothetical protein n=2 Tax=Embleya TaxID=2699295 RepID=UPI0033E76906
MTEDAVRYHEGEVARLARRLLDAPTGGWSRQGVQALVAALGWTWSGAADAAPTGTDLPSGSARLRPVGRFEKDFTSGEDYVELAVPLALPAPDPAAQALAFRQAAEQVADALGEASIMGVYGGLGPYYDGGARWGTPYRRWRGDPDTLELRAGRAGPELVLLPTEPVENWFWRQGHGEPGAITGFFGHRRVAANGGLGLPGGWYARDWEQLTDVLADFLGSLPAETTALDVGLALNVYGRVPGENGAPMLFDLVCRDRLVIGSFPPAGVDAHALGWGSAEEHPGTRAWWPSDAEPPARHDAGGPGEVAARATAELLVATARAAGVPGPEDLIIGGEGERVGAFDVKFYGLGLHSG